jgi:hypothetical protein
MVSRRHLWRDLRRAAFATQAPNNMQRYLHATGTRPVRAEPGAAGDGGAVGWELMVQHIRMQQQ